MPFIVNLKNIVDENLPFSMKNVPKQLKEDIKKYQTVLYQPKKFKFKNDTGIFEATIYLDNHYSVVIDVLIISKKFIIVGPEKIMIQKNGMVCFYHEDYTLKKSVKTETGFVLDNDKKEKILDFISEMKSFSKHLREKYYKTK